MGRASVTEPPREQEHREHFPNRLRIDGIDQDEQQEYTRCGVCSADGATEQAWRDGRAVRSFSGRPAHGGPAQWARPITPSAPSVRARAPRP